MNEYGSLIGSMLVTVTSGSRISGIGVIGPEVPAPEMPSLASRTARWLPLPLPNFAARRNHAGKYESCRSPIVGIASSSAASWGGACASPAMCALLRGGRDHHRGKNEPHQDPADEQQDRGVAEAVGDPAVVEHAGHDAVPGGVRD